MYDDRDDESEGGDDSGELAAVLIGLGHLIRAAMYRR
jgi:hypothetical protein